MKKAKLTWNSVSPLSTSGNFISLLCGISLAFATLGCELLDDTYDDNAVTRAGESVKDQYEAEKATSKSGCSVQKNNAGYSGSGFMDFGGNGTWIEWNNISAVQAGDFKLTFRYANGAAASRQAEVLVNGQKAGNLAFAKTGSWTTWKTNSIDVSLRKGNNTIRVKANTSKGGPNIDYMVVEGEVNVDNCPNDPNKTEPGQCGCGVAEGTCSNNENVALGKSTSQSSTGYNGVSSRAVDGNTNGTWRDGSVTHTNTTSAPWWRVDLGGSFRVDSVTLFNRTDCCSNRLSNFHVDYLDEAGRLIAKKDHPAQAATKTDISLSAQGVYSVRVQLYGTNPLSLAEVQVKGTPDSGGSEQCTVATERSNATLSCPSGEKITQIDFASYGLPTGSCEAGFDAGTCHASVSEFKVRTACLNKQSCTIAASNGIFGDPCSGKQKQLAVEYTCSGGGVVQDLCPSDPDKTTPGVCGCGTPDTDTDSDGTPNCKDNCPNDRQKTTPGTCGCGVPEGTCNNDSDPTDGPLDKASNTKLRIASWNNHRGSIFPKTNSLWRAINTSGKYHVTRTEGAARLIEAVDADIWLMQETCYSSSGLPSGVSKDDVNRQIASYMKSLTGDSWDVLCNGRGLCTLVRGNIRFDGHWERSTRVTGDRVILPDGTRVLIMNSHYMNLGNAEDTRDIIEDIQSSVSAVFVGGDFNDGQGGSRYNTIDGISDMNNLSMYHWKDPFADHLTNSMQNGKQKNTKGYMRWGEGASGEDLVTYIGGGHIDHFFLKSNSLKAGNRLILNTLLFSPETLDLYGLEPLDIALQPQYYLKYFEDFLTDGIIYDIPASAYDAGDKLDHDHLPMIVDFSW